uniref:Agouti-related protein n=1 Tax=Esox lucius TaxID=8010 RepID=A0AAY5K7A9_ESOLU
ALTLGNTIIFSKLKKQEVLSDNNKKTMGLPHSTGPVPVGGSGSDRAHLLFLPLHQDAAEAVLLQSRAQRPPRRCVPHQQSCLGHPLPCCDPCDTCYCRFFNAFCYCRRVGQSCAGGHGRP